MGRADNKQSGTRGFTLIELLVVIGIIALLLAIVLSSIRMVRRSVGMARELSAARQLMVAYSSYAYDHRGVLMPGYYYPGGETLPVFDEAGNELTAPGIMAACYPWRLAGYLGHNLRGLYTDRWLLQEFDGQPNYHYRVSLYPSLGINATFVGGDYQDGGLASDPYQDAVGKLFVSRLSEAKHQARLIVFGSARYIGEFLPEGRAVIEGHHRIDPPFFDDRMWEPSFDPHEDVESYRFGHVSLRHQFRQAVVALLDGSAHTFDEGQMQDMRHWCDQATGPDWTILP